MMANKKPLTLVLSGVLALSMLSPAALAAEGPSADSSMDIPTELSSHNKPNSKPDHGNHNGWEKPNDAVATPGDVMDDNTVTPDQDPTATPGDVMDDNTVTPETPAEEPDEEVEIPEEEVPGTDWPEEVFVREYHLTGAALGAYKEYAQEQLDMDLTDYTCDIVKFNFNDGYWVLAAWNDVFDTWSATPIFPGEHQPEDVTGITLTYHQPWSLEWVSVTIPAEDMDYASYDPCLGLSFVEFTVSEDALGPDSGDITGGDNGDGNPGDTTGGDNGDGNPGDTTGGDNGDGNPGDTTGGDNGAGSSNGDNGSSDTDPDHTTNPDDSNVSDDTTHSDNVIYGPVLDHQTDAFVDETVIDEEEVPLASQPVENVEQDENGQQMLADQEVPLTDAAEVQPVLAQQAGETAEVSTPSDSVVVKDAQLPMGELPQTGMVIGRGDTAVAAVLSAVGLGLACTGLYLASRKEDQQD